MRRHPASQPADVRHGGPRPEPGRAPAAIGAACVPATVSVAAALSDTRWPALCRTRSWTPPAQVHSGRLCHFPSRHERAAGRMANGGDPNWAVRLSDCPTGGCAARGLHPFELSIMCPASLLDCSCCSAADEFLEWMASVTSKAPRAAGSGAGPPPAPTSPTGSTSKPKSSASGSIRRDRPVRGLSARRHRRPAAGADRS
jgi:hypothetical protein